LGDYYFRLIFYSTYINKSISSHVAGEFIALVLIAF
jgi:hypothetical protein